MNRQASKQADDQFYKNHPELVDKVTGVPKPLTMSDKDKNLRQEWMKDYKGADEASKKGLAVCDVGGVLVPCNAAPPPPPPPPAPASAPPAVKAPPPPSCKVEIRATKISELGYYHMFIVYTDEKGKVYYLRGGPSPSGPVSSGSLISELSGGSSHSASVKSSASSSASSESSGSSQPSGSSGSSQSSSPSQPSGSNPSASSDSSRSGGGGGPFGYIVTEYGEYKPIAIDPVTGARTGSIDWDPSAKAVTVSSGPGTCGKYDELKKAIDGVASSKTRYNPLGPNSNSTVFSALEKVGITPKTPDGVWVPGYDTPVTIK